MQKTIKRLFLINSVYVTRGANGVESRKIYHVPIPATTKNYAHMLIFVVFE